MKKIIVAESLLGEIDEHHTLFSRGNIQSLPAATTEDVLRIHKVELADLIIVDCAMPTIGGAGLCATIRSMHDLKQASLILASDGSPAADEQCSGSKANAVIKRPVDMFELFSRISELIAVPQRQHFRALLHAAVNGRGKHDTFIGVTSNISISGLLFESEKEIEMGEIIDCTLSIGNREISVECVIMRAEKVSFTRRRYGIKFINLDTKSMVIIDQYVKGSITH